MKRKREKKRGLEFLSICIMILGIQILMTFFHGILSMIKEQEE